MDDGKPTCKYSLPKNQQISPLKKLSIPNTPFNTIKEKNEQKIFVTCESKRLISQIYKNTNEK